MNNELKNNFKLTGNKNVINNDDIKKINIEKIKNDNKSIEKIKQKECNCDMDFGVHRFSCPCFGEDVCTNQDIKK